MAQFCIALETCDVTDDSMDTFACCLAPRADSGQPARIVQPIPLLEYGSSRVWELMQQDLAGATSNEPEPQALPAAANVQGSSGTQQFLVQALAGAEE